MNEPHERDDLPLPSDEPLEGDTPQQNDFQALCGSQGEGDQDFVAQLRRLEPAGMAEGESALHRMLFEAGFRDGQRAATRATSRAGRQASVFNGSSLAVALAAGVVSAALTLAISAAVDQRADDPRKIAGDARTSSSLDEPVPNSDADEEKLPSPPGRQQGQDLPPERSPAGVRGLRTLLTGEPGKVSSRATRLRPFLGAARREETPHPGRMTAFNLSALESDPPSSWLSLEDDNKTPVQTVYAGTLEPIALEMQVLPR